MVKPSLYDTICAIATPPGEGGIAVIRISGQDSFNVINKIFFRNNKRIDSHSISSDDANKIIYGFIFDNEILIDEVLISVFKSPNSFTGEDIIEISCHGGFFIANKIITLLNKLNIRI
ncbi:MAG TPA: tRNA uridine-5-carboxymethylaminomethyl(34) synthesis GTPase MnmE, partial [Bacteroidetes bacterium]|nr:tRNA uridine-5-carboxymethylaminomethyl(34) synthesis GTPase MnmE [Bacteroidota bacterium]